MAKTFLQMVEEARGETVAISPEDAQAQQQRDPNTMIVDVREPDQVAQGGIPGAANVPLGVLAIQADQELPEAMRNPELQDRSRPIVTTCALGGQAALGAKTLKDMGFTNVKVLDGGLEGWSKAGLPTESKASAS